MPAKLWFVLRRLLQVVPVVLAIAALNFLLLHLAPGDAADIIAAQSGGARCLRDGAVLARPDADRPVLYHAGRASFRRDDDDRDTDERRRARARHRAASSVAYADAWAVLSRDLRAPDAHIDARSLHLR